MPTEAQIVSILQQAILTSPLFVALAVFLARWLILAFGVFFLFLLTSKKGSHRHAVLEGAWSLILTLAVTATIAYFVQRSRPFLGAVDPGFPIIRLIPEPLNTSFPSGHAGTSFAMASAIFFANRRLGILAFATALAVSLGRVLVGVHFPSDLAGGVLVGVGCFAIVRFFHGQIRSRDIETSARHHHHA